MHLQKLVDLLRARSTARSDAPFSARFKDQRVFTLGRCHGRDDSGLPLQKLIVEVSPFELLFHAPHAGKKAQHAGHAADFLHLTELFGQVLQIKLPLGHPFGDGLGFFLIDGLCRALNETNHIAHAKDAASDAFGVKIFQTVELLTRAKQLDRLTRNRPHGEGRAAASIAVDAG